MSRMRSSIFPFRSTVSRSLFLVLLFTGILVVGLVACDAGGSSNNDNGDTNDDDEVAQTFNVTVENVDSSYPYSDQNGIGVAYAINGEIGKVVTLERGKTYEFELGDGVDPNHPFYIGTTAEGGSGDEFRDDPAKETTGSVTFSPPMDAPDSLFYVCGVHAYMGGEMEITSSDETEDNY